MKPVACLAAYAVLCGAWMVGADVFGMALAVVFVLAGSALLMLVGVGYDGLRLAIDSTQTRLREGIREPRDTLTHILMLAEHSRRNGLVGLAEVETNWAPLHRVCVLVASAADEQRIRIEASASLDAARLRSNAVISPWLFMAIALLVTGLLGTLLLASVDASAMALVLAPVVVAVGTVALLVAPIGCRLVMARESELACIQLVYEGAMKILNNNNVDAVFHGLASLVPGAPSTVVASEIGDLDTGRGPWL